MSWWVSESEIEPNDHPFMCKREKLVWSPVGIDPVTVEWSCFACRMPLIIRTAGLHCANELLFVEKVSYVNKREKTGKEEGKWGEYKRKPGPHQPNHNKAVIEVTVWITQDIHSVEPWQRLRNIQSKRLKRFHQHSTHFASVSACFFFSLFSYFLVSVQKFLAKVSLCTFILYTLYFIHNISMFLACAHSQAKWLTLP